MKIESIETALAPYGLKLRGILALTAEEIRDYQLNGQSLALVGNVGSSFWPVFVESKEYSDGRAHPLDRWSQRVAGEIATQLGAEPIFPFQGPPYLPFQRWAGRSEALRQSPIGLMMHPQYGLWHAYRFGLLMREKIKGVSTLQDSPCLSCIDQPCLNTCPANAICDNGYDVSACKKHLNEHPDADCFQHGCMARYVCPAGREYRYVDEQSQFHLRAFVSARFD